jgi:hypothetical protein
MQGAKVKIVNFNISKQINCALFGLTKDGIT